MKKTYLRPEMKFHCVAVVETLCLSITNKAASPNSSVLSNERFIIEDMENEAAAAGEEDLW